MCTYLLSTQLFLEPTVFLFLLDVFFNRMRGSTPKRQFGLDTCVVHADQAQTLVGLHNITRYVGSVLALIAHYFGVSVVP